MTHQQSLPQERLWLSQGDMDKNIQSADLNDWETSQRCTDYLTSRACSWCYRSPHLVDAGMRLEIGCVTRRWSLSRNNSRSALVESHRVARSQSTLDSVTVPRFYRPQCGPRRWRIWRHHWLGRQQLMQSLRLPQIDFPELYRESLSGYSRYFVHLPWIPFIRIQVPAHWLGSLLRHTCRLLRSRPIQSLP